MSVPVSSNQQCFFLTNDYNKEWISHLLKTAGSDELTEDDVAAGIMVYLIKQHPSALQKLGEMLQIPQLMVNNRMDAHTAAAMWNEANTTIRGQRTINRYVYNYYGFRLTPYDEELRKLTDHHVKPIHKKSKVNKRKITWWYKEIDEVVLNLLNNDWNETDFDAIDIVFGGDHSAGVFAGWTAIQTPVMTSACLHYWSCRSSSRIAQVSCFSVKSLFYSTAIVQYRKFGQF